MFLFIALWRGSAPKGAVNSASHVYRECRPGQTDRLVSNKTFANATSTPACSQILCQTSPTNSVKISKPSNKITARLLPPQQGTKSRHWTVTSPPFLPFTPLSSLPHLESCPHELILNFS